MTDNDTPKALDTTDTEPVVTPPTTTITDMIPAPPGWWALFKSREYKHSVGYRVVAWIARNVDQDPTALLAVKGWLVLLPATDFMYLDDPGPFDTYKYFHPPAAPLYTG